MSNSRLLFLSTAVSLSVCFAFIAFQSAALFPIRVVTCPQSLHIAHHIELITPAPEENVSYPEILERALSFRSGLHGFHSKKGVLHPVQWRPEFRQRRKSETLKWLQMSYFRHGDLQPPWQYPGCLVHINHHYKFIWIKGKKVGGTTMRESLGWICNDVWEVPWNANKTYCSEMLHKNTVMSLEEAKQYWSEYFVFAFVRNPYSRFASSYSYINGISSVNASFVDTCREPFIHAKIASVAGINKQHLTQHHIHHMMEQSSCFMTKTNELAVDFVGETENLVEDLGTVLAEINRRKPNHLPKLELDRDQLPRRNSNKKDSYALKLYAKHPECLVAVQKFFVTDFKKLKYQKLDFEAETNDTINHPDPAELSE